MLNKYPTIIMPTPTTPIKMNIKGSFNTFLRIIISGSDSPITDIINAREVPIDAPFSIRDCTTGIIPAALEYNGIPISTDRGTDHQTSFPIIPAMKFSGT